MSRLGAVGRVRALQERQALGRVAAAERAVRSAGEVLASRTEALAGLAPPHRSLTALELRVLELQGLAQHDLVRDARDAVGCAEDRSAALLRAWSLASTRRKSVERLEQTRIAEAAVVARAAADRALDESVLLRWRTT